MARNEGGSMSFQSTTITNNPTIDVSGVACQCINYHH
jgi:hypothetical protein